jgi:hypothetical protein
MTEVSTFRLYLLRAMYTYMFVGLAIFKWPGILNFRQQDSFIQDVDGVLAIARKATLTNRSQPTGACYALKDDML